MQNPTRETRRPNESAIDRKQSHAAISSPSEDFIIAANRTRHTLNDKLTQPSTSLHTHLKESPKILGPKIRNQPFRSFHIK